MSRISAAKEHRAPYELVAEVAERGSSPVVLFTAGGIATPADAALDDAAWCRWCVRRFWNLQVRQPGHACQGNRGGHPPTTKTLTSLHVSAQVWVKRWSASTLTTFQCRTVSAERGW
jgi:hypothetical protein